MIGEALGLLGAALVLIAAVGVARFGDPLSRLHALSKASTLGILLILAGVAVNLHDLNDLTSTVLAAALHLLTSPPASNMLSRATYLSVGLAPGATVDEHADAVDAVDGMGDRPAGDPT